MVTLVGCISQKIEITLKIPNIALVYQFYLPVLIIIFIARLFLCLYSSVYILPYLLKYDCNSIKLKNGEIILLLQEDFHFISVSKSL